MPEKKIARVAFPAGAFSPEQPPPTKRAAAYARVSTMKDARENSLQSQQEYFTEYIQRHPDWVFAGMYADDGISGLSIRRQDGFNRMAADALDGKIDLIRTESLLRFARNTMDAFTTIRSLKAAGAAVCFQKEDSSTMDSTGEFLITLMSSFAEEESRSISENVTWADAIRRSLHHLLKTHKNIIPDCAALLSQTLGDISSAARPILNIAHGKLNIQIDGLMISIYIQKMVVTPKTLLDFSKYYDKICKWINIWNSITM